MVVDENDPFASAWTSISSMNGESSNAATAALPASPTPRSEVAIGLAAFITEHYDRLLRLAWLVCRDGSDAGDAVQVGLEQAWRRQGSLRDSASMRPWLDRIVVREAGRIAKRRRGLVARILAPRHDVAWIEQADERLGDRDDRMALRAAFDRLSPDHRAVVALHLHAGYSVSETADLVGVPMETVRSRLRVAKQHLRRDLGEGIR
jgi:RNA polymerase sigma-70 factor (ECF subfamily)